MLSKITVIIPTYNSAKYIKEAVDSALSQTYKDIEIIVVDDGSTDNTKDVLKKYIDNGKIRYIYQANGGPASARNKGINNSSGEFIAFLDADDIWFPDKLKKQIPLFNNSDIGLVYSDMEFFGDKFKYCYYSEILKRKMLKGYVYKNLILENFIPTSSVVIKRRILYDVGFFNEDRKLFAVEDYDLWLRITKKYKVDFINELLVKYRIHSHKISGSRNKSYYGLCKVYKEEFRRASPLSKPIILIKYIESMVKYFISWLL